MAGANAACTSRCRSSACRCSPTATRSGSDCRPPSARSRRSPPFLGGDRPVDVIDAASRRGLDLPIVVPVEDMEHPVAAGDVTGGGEGKFQLVGGGRPARRRRPGPAHGRVVAGDLPEAARAREEPPLDDPCSRTAGCCASGSRSGSTSSPARSWCAPTTARSSHDQRREIEEALKAGRLPALIATSSLELGIDMGAVDLVVQVESPGACRAACSGSAAPATTSAARASAGSCRSSVATCSRPRSSRGRCSRRGRSRPACPGQCARRARPADRRDGRRSTRGTVAELERVLPGATRTASSRTRAGSACSTCSPAATRPTSSPSCGRACPGTARPTCSSRRKGARLLAVVNGGTIPDRGLYGVHLGAEGPRRRRARRGDGRRDPQGRDVHPRRRRPGGSRTSRATA